MISAAHAQEAAKALGTTNTSTEAATALHANHMSLLDLFFQADLFVQSVMMLLLACSVIGIALFLAKWMQFSRLKAASRRFEKAFFDATDFGQLYEKERSRRNRSPLHHVFCVGLEEYWQAKESGNLAAGVLPRVRRKMDIVLNREMTGAERGLGFLATVGATAPFIGLLGTVWGIMGSFQGIAAAKNTSLAIVAPGIAEALLATAFGLFAAIPAVIAYNKLSGDVGGIASRTEAFAGELLSILERQEEQSGKGKA